MTHHEARQSDMLKRVQVFGTAHAADFPKGSVGAQKIAEINAAVPQLKALGAQQVSGAGAAKSGTSTKAGAFAALHAQLDAISGNAHALAALGTTGLEAKFRLPRSGGKQALLNAARAFAQDALPLKKQFIGLNMPADFLDTLEASIAECEAAFHVQQAGARQKGTATAGIKDTFHTALVAVSVLDRIVRNTYRNAPASLAEWTIATHIAHAPKAAKPTPPAPSPSSGTAQ